MVTGEYILITALRRYTINPGWPESSVATICRNLAIQRKFVYTANKEYMT